MLFFCLITAVFRIVLCTLGRFLAAGRILHIGILHIGALHVGIFSGITVVFAFAVSVVCLVCHNDCLLY